MINRKRIRVKIGSLALAAIMLSGCGAAAENKKPDSQAVSEAGIQEAGESQADRPAEAEPRAKAGTSTESTGKMPAFTAKDLQGNEVTESIFGDKDLTVVNIWGTFCPPCIGEMPELGEWAKAMPDNVQLVGLIIDIQGDGDTEHRDLAVEITQKAEAEFMQIIANQDFYGLLSQVVGVPTTLFVDKEGNIVGDPIIGADVDGYKQFVEDYLDGQ